MRDEKIRPNFKRILQGGYRLLITERWEGGEAKWRDEEEMSPQQSIQIQAEDQRFFHRLKHVYGRKMQEVDLQTGDQVLL